MANGSVTGRLHAIIHTARTGYIARARQTSTNPDPSLLRMFRQTSRQERAQSKSEETEGSYSLLDEVVDMG